MYPRVYPCPFRRAVSPVRCRSVAGDTLPRRIHSLAAEYRLGFALGTLLSVLVHGLFWFAGPEPRPHPAQPNVIGYEGPTRVMAIRVVDPETDQEILAEERRRSGALVATEIRTEEREASPVPRETIETERNEPATKTETPYYVLEAPPTVADAPREEPIRIELREDLSVVSSTSAAAQSPDIKLLWVVRPDYPAYARKNGVQGLVRLEAEVGISGKVLDVHVLEAPDGGLALAASRSLLLWEFQPLNVGGQLRRFRVIVPFRFTLVG